MPVGLLGRKIGMTQVYKADGTIVPVTVIEAGPCVVTQVRSAEKDGYEAVQLGYGIAKRLNKPEQGHMAKAGKGAFEVLKEFRLDDVSQFQVGQEIKAADLRRGRGRSYIIGPLQPYKVFLWVEKFTCCLGAIKRLCLCPV